MRYGAARKDSVANPRIRGTANCFKRLPRVMLAILEVTSEKVKDVIEPKTEETVDIVHRAMLHNPKT